MALADLIVQSTANQPNFVNSFLQAKNAAIQQQAQQQALAQNQAAMQKQQGIQSLLAQNASPAEMAKFDPATAAQLATVQGQIQKNDYQTRWNDFLKKNPTASPKDVFNAGFANEAKTLAGIQDAALKKAAKATTPDEQATFTLITKMGGLGGRFSPTRIQFMKGNIDDMLQQGMKPEDIARSIVNGKIDNKLTQNTVEAYSQKGKIGQNITTFGTALNHMDTFVNLARKVDNTNPQSVNRFYNAMKKEFGNTNITDLQAMKNIMIGEVGKAITNGVIPVELQQKLDKNLTDANTLDQMIGVANTLKDALGGKLVPLKQAYLAGTPTFDDKTARARFDKLLGPKTAALITRVESEMAAGTSGIGGSQTLTPQDKQAIAWARANPKDPRSIKILQLHGMP